MVVKILCPVCQPSKGRSVLAHFEVDSVLNPVAEQTVVLTKSIKIQGSQANCVSYSTGSYRVRCFRPTCGFRIETYEDKLHAVIAQAAREQKPDLPFDLVLTDANTWAYGTRSKQLRATLKASGITIDRSSESGRHKAYNDVLESVKQNPENEILATVLGGFGPKLVNRRGFQMG